MQDIFDEQKIVAMLSIFSCSLDVHTGACFSWNLAYLYPITAIEYNCWFDYGYGKCFSSNKFVFQDSMAAEASKLLKGVDTVALHLAKTALTRDASVSEASNVGKSRTDFKNFSDNAD